MTWIKQSLIFAGIAVLCALGTYLIHGEYDRRVPCVQSELEEHEVCLSTVLDDWAGNVVWVDARAEEEKLVKLTSALEITEAKADEELSSEEVLLTLFKAKGGGTNVVVFCQTDGCGSSKYIREKIITSGSHDKVYYLHGGWKAIASDGRLLENESFTAR
ncbi:MAG: rhodanese-like domain-containing protein [Rubritalea sp.]